MIVVRGFLVLVVSAFLLLAGGSNTVTLPQPYATPSVYRYPKVIPQPDGAHLRVPPGFQVEVYADGFQCPRFMILGPGGEILVSDSVRAVTPSRTIREPEKNADHDANTGAVYLLTGQKQHRTLAGSLNKPYGLAFWKDYLYIAESESIKRYRYDKKSLSVGPGQEVIEFTGLGGFHWTRTLLFDPTGTKLYVAIGSGSNNTIGEDPRRATICRYNPDGSGFEIFAAGLRNPVGLHWYPGSETLWATVQERDEMGDELVPDFFTHIEAHGFYGWPYAYIGPHPDPFNSGFQLIKHAVKRPQVWTDLPKISHLISTALTPDALLGGHVAPLDYIFYTGNQFPSEYRGGAFVALHGSSNRSKRVGYSVAFIPFRDGKPAGPVREFLTGWMLSPDSDEVWGRPVGLLQLPDGSLLVSDDGGRKIWRVTYKG